MTESQMRFDQGLEGRVMRFYFSDGEIVEGKVIDVAGPSDGDGFVFESRKTNSPEGCPGKRKSIWAKFADLAKYEVLEA
jgi:hypothetical protein